MKFLFGFGLGLALLGLGSVSGYRYASTKSPSAFASCVEETIHLNANTMREYDCLNRDNLAWIYGVCSERTGGPP